MKPLLFSLLLAIPLSAQLVPKSEPQAPAKGQKTSKTTKNSSAKPKEDDLLDKLKFPKRFECAVLSKSGNTLLVSATGKWKPVSAIQGGSSSVEYSHLASSLEDFLTPGSGSQYRFSFNIGQKNGHVVVRTFMWPEANFGYVDPNKPIIQEDEGEGIQRGDVYTFETDKFRILLREIKADQWQATEAKLYRWTGSEFQPANTPLAYYGANGQLFPNQFVPTWACGSYLTLSDGLLGRAYFKFFGGKQLYIVPYCTNDEVFGYALNASTQNGAGVHPDGGENLSALWSNGISEFGATANDYSVKGVSVRLTGKCMLSDVSVRGRSDSGNQSYSSQVTGTSEPIPLDGKVIEEILDRSKETGWALSAGPYSLNKTLLKAYKGCTLVGPILSFPLRGQDDWSVKNYIKNMTAAYGTEMIRWQEDAAAGEATYKLPPELDNNMPATAGSIKQPGPLGRLFPPGVDVPTRESLDAQKKAELVAGFAKVPVQLLIKTLGQPQQVGLTGDWMGMISVGMEWLKDPDDPNCKKYQGKIHLALPDGVRIYSNELRNRTTIENGKVCIVWRTFTLISKGQGTRHLVFNSEEVPEATKEVDLVF